MRAHVDLLEDARSYLMEGQFTKATGLMLLSIAEDTRKLLVIAEKNQRYIEQTMKEMGHDRGSEAQ